MSAFIQSFIRAFRPRLAGIALGLLIIFSVLPDAAWSHSSLLRTEPADGAVLGQPPAQATLTFNEPVSPLVLRLVQADGRAIDLTQVIARDETLSAPLPAHLAQGNYLLSWRVVSADGHPVGGTVTFSIGSGSQARTPMAVVQEGAAGLRPAIWLAGLALFMGLLFGVGGLIFDSWVRPELAGRHAQRSHIGWLVLGLAAAPLSLGLQGVDALGTSLTAFFRLEVWKSALETSYGTLALAAMAAILAGLWACGTTAPRLRSLLALVSLLLLGGALASSGHAATAVPGGVSRVAVFIHVVMAAGWLGALTRLPPALRSGDGPATLRRFAGAAVWLMILLVASGATLAYWQLTRVQDLWLTQYGRILSLKLILIALLLVLAAVNRWRLTAPVLQGERVQTKALLRNIRIEWILAAAILAVVALWRFTPPPRALQPATATIALHLHGTGAMADVALHPGPEGHVRIGIVLSDAEYIPMQPRDITVLLSNQAAGVEPIRRDAHRIADGSWQVDDMPLGVPGKWSIRLEALISDFDSIGLQGEADIVFPAS